VSLAECRVTMLLEADRLNSMALREQYWTVMVFLLLVDKQLDPSGSVFQKSLPNPKTTTTTYRISTKRNITVSEATTTSMIMAHDWHDRVCSDYESEKG
jgi:hypothetical protein